MLKSRGPHQLLTIVISSLVRYRESRRLAAESMPTQVKIENPEPPKPQLLPKPPAPPKPELEVAKLTPQEIHTH